MAEFIVITEVPDPDDPSGVMGNLATALGALFIGADPEELNPTSFIHMEQADYLGGAAFGLAMSLRLPMFILGEILVCDGDGREIGGRGRKPDKWDVRTETFSDANKAASRSVEVLTR